MRSLVALLDGVPVATLGQDGNRAWLDYEPRWRDRDDAFPLSLSMPLAAAHHATKPVDAFLWGLLPDNDQVLERWAARFGVSPRNAFALLAHVGEDCAGAVQLVTPERVGIVESMGSVDWLSDADLHRRLRTVRDDAASGRIARDTGQFSLAGAQPKTALLRDPRGRWGVPSGRIPTTHILKPASPAFDGHAENEHLCLATAARLGLVAARSEVLAFDDLHAIVVERYDRTRTAEGVITRLHQEDMCQALAIHPALKYENDRGPGAAAIVGLLRRAVHDPDVPEARASDLWRFVDALLFAWITGNTDAHAKNYGLLIDRDGVVRLAPLYDLGSIYAHADIDPRRAKLAMRVAGRYRIEEIVPRHWAEEAKTLGLDPARLVDRARALAAALPDAMTDAANAMRNDGLHHPAVARMAETIIRRAGTIAAA